MQVLSRTVKEKNSEACDEQLFQYVLFYYYAMRNNKVYNVVLKENDVTKMEDVAVCHLDMTKWN